MHVPILCESLEQFAENILLECCNGFESVVPIRDHMMVLSGLCIDNRIAYFVATRYFMISDYQNDKISLLFSFMFINDIDYSIFLPDAFSHFPLVYTISGYEAAMMKYKLISVIEK